MTSDISDYISRNEQIQDKDVLETYFAIWDAQTYLLPVICGLGFVTNSLSLLVFLQTSLRRLSCSVYLAAKAVSDFLFLGTVFIIWLSRLEIGVFHTTGVCQIVVFLSYITAFISIWLAVSLTVENLLCVVKPWYVQRTCNAYSATIITIVITALGVLLYHFSLWNNGVRIISTNEETFPNITFQSDKKELGKKLPVNESFVMELEYYSKFQENLSDSKNGTKDNTPGKSIINFSETNTFIMCTQLSEFNQFIVVTTYIDSVVTLLLPLLILIVTNVVIVTIAARTTRRRSRLHENKRQYQLPGTHFSNHRKSSASLEAQASRLLFAVSMTTLLFHFPFHVIRLKSMLFSVTNMNILLTRIFETIYYTHHAIGFFVYLIFGVNFRKVFSQLVFKRSH